MTRADDFSGRLGGDEILMAFQKMPVKVMLKKAEIIRCYAFSDSNIPNRDFEKLLDELRKEDKKLWP